MLDGQTGLRQSFELQRLYAQLYDAYLVRGVNQTLDRNDKENRFTEAWQYPHYFSVGADALRLVISALVGNLREPPRTILDFPSGSGRATRHFRSFFPEAKIVACDLYSHHVDFCADELAVEGRLSRENFDEVDFEESFDLIFCGSLLTHLPDDLFRSAFRLVARSLSDQGIAVITVHGRHSPYIQWHKFKYIEDNLFEEIEASVKAAGFGYADYTTGVRSIFDQQNRYGISVSLPHWTMQLTEQDESIRVLGYVERGWDDHQDVLVIGRPGIHE